MPHVHPQLDYAFDALEPYIDAQTMQFHYEKHHGTAVATLNNAVAGTPAEGKPVEELLASVSSYTTAIRNSAGSHYNHSTFWKSLSPEATTPSAELADAIDKTFGSLEALKDKMNTVGAAHFASGWVWLIVKDGKLKVVSTINQDNPLMDMAPVRGTPILGIDIWEHAYYLKYQNRRAAYLANIWNVINWDEVSRRYSDTL